MAKTAKWLRELPRLRGEAERSRTETWARRDIERLFSLGRVQAQALMKAVGGLRTIAGAHFLERSALLAFLDELVQAPEPGQAFQSRLLAAEPAPRPRPLRVRLPPDLRSAMLPDLPANVRLSPGRLVIEAATAELLAESLLALALAMQNDDRWRGLVEPPAPPPPVEEDELDDWLQDLRFRHAGQDSSSGAPAKNP